MDTSRTDRLIAEAWDGDIVPQLVEYIRIPNKSPMFDADWQKHGHMDADGSASIRRPWRSEVRATSISPMIFSSVSASDSKPPVSG